MKLHPPLLAASALLAILGAAPARADDGILSFELAEPQWANEAVIAPAEAETMAATPAPDAANQPLPIPAQAANPPMRYHSPQQLPAGVYRRGVAVALNESTSATALLPPAPPTPAVSVVVAAAPPKPEPVPEPVPVPQAEPQEPAALGALDFAMAPSPAVMLARAEQAQPKQLANPLLSLFDGDSDSLVAWAVGSAEGTRTPDGAINPAYFGHTDPGNRVWNMGTFSYQHGAKTPQEADQKQLARLKNQGDVLRQRALKHGLNLTLEETLNGLDLANQSPLASIGRVGYIERLAEAKANGYEGSEAILVARTRSYINPNTGRWNAPGLGNTEPSIRRDQKRRADAVAKAIAAYQAKDPNLQPQAWTLTPSPAPETLVALAEAPAEAVDEILQMWTSPSDPVAQGEAVTDVAAAAEPTEPALAAIPNDDRLAALWQITVDRFSPTGGDAASEAVPQGASIAGMLFNRNPAPEPSAGESQSLDGSGDASENIPGDGFGDISGDRAEPTPAADPSAPPAPEENPAADRPGEVSPQPLAEAASPTWADVREGHQTTLGLADGEPQAATPGAVPDSAVYVPSVSQNDEPLEFPQELVEFEPPAEVSPELGADELPVPLEPAAAAVEPDPDAADGAAVAPGEPAEPGEDAIAPQPLLAAEGAEPEVTTPASTAAEPDDSLGFEKADPFEPSSAPEQDKPGQSDPATDTLPTLSPRQKASAEGSAPE